MRDENEHSLLKMSETNETTSTTTPNPLIQYVENFIEKRDNEIRAQGGETPSPLRTRRAPIVVKTGNQEFGTEDLVNQIVFLSPFFNT